MADCGIVYVATNHDRYIKEAFLSADSIKQRNPDLPVTLFTDLPDHALCKTDRFDGVMPIVGVQGIGSRWAGGQLNRLRCLTRTPYVRTLHLDTDTRVLTEELPSLFTLLDEHAHLCAQVDDACRPAGTRLRDQAGRRSQAGATDPRLSADQVPRVAAAGYVTVVCT